MPDITTPTDPGLTDPGLTDPRRDALLAERSHLDVTLTRLRPLFPGAPDLEILQQVLQSGNCVCSPETVLHFARNAQSFFTSDVMQHFMVDKFKAAGCLAPLTRTKKIQRTKEKDALGHSRYVWIG